MQKGYFRINTIIAMLLVFSGASFLFGFYIGHSNRSEAQKILSLVNKDDALLRQKEEVVDFSPFWKTWNLIDEKFVGTATTTTDQERVWGAIEGLVTSLGDPYSVFLPPVDSETFAENISGNFGGVGMEVGMRDNALTVIAPLKNTPAERAAILSSYKIL